MENNDGVLPLSVQVTQETKRLAYLAGPMVAVTMSHFLLQLISNMMAGHLGELALASTAMAVSLASASGFSILVGLSSALEMLCGQAYGAQQYVKVGKRTNTGIFCLICVSIPLSISWMNMEKVLLLVGQDPTISHEVGRFMTYLIPALFGSAILQPLVRFFETQSLIKPLLVSAIATIVIHVPLCWALVFKSRLHSIGGAVAMDVSIWVNVACLGIYMRYSSSCAQTRTPLSIDLFKGILEFFKVAIPSGLMICLEWWSYEIIVLLSGRLPNPNLQASIISVCVNTVTTLYSIPYGLGAATSTRVSNELGAGKPKTARLVAYTAMLLGALEGVTISAVLFASRNVFGSVFSNKKEVVDHVRAMAPFVCMSLIVDSLQGTLSGIAMGCGWQRTGAVINFGAFYLIGIPLAVILAFVVKLGPLGLWIGILCGSLTQLLLLAIIACFINWEHQSTRARRN